MQVVVEEELMHQILDLVAAEELVVVVEVETLDIAIAIQTLLHQERLILAEAVAAVAVTAAQVL
jgi:hypothetical protein